MGSEAVQRDQRSEADSCFVRNLRQPSHAWSAWDLIPITWTEINTYRIGNAAGFGAHGQPTVAVLGSGHSRGTAADRIPALRCIRGCLSARPPLPECSD